MTRPPYAIGARVVTRRHGTGVIERCYPVAAARNRSFATYLIRIPGRKRAVLLYAGEIREARA